MAQRLSQDSLSCCLRTSGQLVSASVSRRHSSTLQPTDEVDREIAQTVAAQVHKEHGPDAEVPDIAIRRNTYSQDHVRRADLRLFDDEDRALARHGTFDDAVLSRRQAHLLQTGEDNASLFAIARAAGCDLMGHEYEAFKQACATPFPRISDTPQLHDRFGLEGVQLELVRRSNVSMPCQENQRVYGTVYTVAKNKVWVDVGHSSLAVVHRKVRRHACSRHLC